MGHDSYRNAQPHDSFGKQPPADIRLAEPARAPARFLELLALFAEQHWATAHLPLQGRVLVRHPNQRCVLEEKANEQILDRR